MLASRMDWILCLFYSSRSNSAETLALQSLLLRLVESQETRRQLCGGKLLLRIWLAPDEAAKIFKFCIRLEVYVWAYITVRCRKNASLCPTNGSPWGALFGIKLPLNQLQIIGSSAANVVILLSCFLIQVASLNEPDPLFSLVPRVAYLPFLFSDVLEHFKKSISRMGQPYELWFDYNNIVSWPDLKGNPGMLWFPIDSRGSEQKDIPRRLSHAFALCNCCIFWIIFVRQTKRSNDPTYVEE